jgi:uncharacterized protein YbjT (DUF2867 family)
MEVGPHRYRDGVKVLVTGATGYIGGRLVPRLLESGFEVRCMTRDAAQLDLAPWKNRVEVVEADVLEGPTLKSALGGCDAAFYLIHSMGGSRDFADADRRGAENFRDAAEVANLKRIVYLGGLGSDTGKLSEHLASRHEVGFVLSSGRTPTTVLRAAVIIGSGSMSFEMIRHLTEVLPIMARPRWIRTRCQPIGVRDVLAILVAAIDDPESEHRVFDIGGSDVLTYEEMMQAYAETAGLRKRIVVPVPLLGPRFSRAFIGMVTPLPPATIKPLIDSVRHDVVVTNPSPPGFHPSTLLSYREAVRLALRRVQYEGVETRWSDATARPAAPMPHDPAWSGEKMYIDRKIAESTASADDLLWAVTRVGGDVGYYALNWSWTVRGWLDQLVGGVGVRRGRRHPEDLRLGEALDFFRVVEIDRVHRRLTLEVEMKVPGTGWLGWAIDVTPTGSRLIQSARFAPRGLFGRLYWFSMLPFHGFIFRRMARNIARTAERRGSIAAEPA